MELCEVTVNIVFLQLKNSFNRNLTQKVISYFDFEDLKTLSLVMERTGQRNSFSQLIQTYFFLLNFLNRIDRSMYYTFYDEQQFKKVQDTHFIQLAQNHSTHFIQYPKLYKRTFNFIRNLIPSFLQSTQFIQELERMLFDPDLPLPKLKRENQGIHCKTPFQNFLVSLKTQRNQFQELPESFADLKEYFETQDEKYLKNLFIKCNKDKILNVKIRSLRFTPYEITYENIEEYLCEKNSLHNLLCSIYAISDIWLSSTKKYLSSLNDPFHRYVQLLTRYSIYRNYVISVQENLYFAFEQYDDLYGEVFGNDKPKYRFWRSAMTKWLKKMEEFHPQCQQVYHYCLTKLRMDNLLKNLEQKEAQSPQIFMQFLSYIGFRSIRNKLSLRQYELEVNKNIYKNELSNEVQNFFQQNWDQYQVIAIQYLQYLVDLSINQETVHWCGHSKQPLSQPYQVFQKQFLCNNRTFLKYLDGCRKEQQISKAEYLKCIFQIQQNFFHKIQIKPVLLREVVEDYNNMIFSEENILKEQAMIEKEELIKYNFAENDELLKYFNQKAKIKFIIKEEELCFYSINPLLPADELLTKSVNTTADSQFSDDSENQSECEKCEMYCSDDDGSISEQISSQVQSYHKEEETATSKMIEDPWMKVQEDELEKGKQQEQKISQGK